MPNDKPPSNLSLWLEEALTGWLLPVAGLVLAGAAWGAYVLGLLPEGPTAGVLAVLVALVVALLMVRPALSAAVDRTTRGLVFAAAALAALVCVAKAVGATWPGAPLAVASLAKKGDTIQLPDGFSGRVRLLVHAPLPEGGTPQADFRLWGAELPIQGHVERTVSSVRVGRGSRANVAHDLNETWVRGTVRPGTQALTLDRLSGQVAGPLEVMLFAEVVPPLAWVVLGAVALALAAVGESRLRKGGAGALCGMVLAYGFLVAGNATPSQAVGTSLGAVLLGGLGGALLGALAALLARLGPWRLDPEAADRRGSPRKA